MLSTSTASDSTGSLDAPRFHEAPRPSPPRLLRVAVVDDHLLFRQGLSAILATQPDMIVVAGASDARALADTDLAPDVVIVDVGLHQKCGAAATREVLRRYRNCRVLALAGVSDEGLAARTFAAGAAGYALKDQDAADVIAAIRAVAGGARYVAPGLSAALPAEGRPAAKAGGIEDLTPREHEVFNLVVQGRSNRGIAERLHISIKTVEAHRSAINRKLSAHSTADLVRIAARHGLLTT
ncbi:MAG: response regulator transcription factor [Minicystis sp.]